MQNRYAALLLSLTVLLGAAMTGCDGNKASEALDAAVEIQTSGEEAAGRSAAPPSQPTPTDEKSGAESAVSTVRDTAQEQAQKPEEVKPSASRPAAVGPAEADTKTGEAEIMKELEGAWEPRGYIGPRAEIEGNRLVRLWRASPVLDTTFTVSRENGRTLLMLKDSELKYSGESRAYASVKECRYEDGALIFVDDFPITGESTDTLYLTDNSRYGNFTVVDDELLPQLEGLWTDGDGACLSFEGSVMRCGLNGEMTETVEIIALKNNSTGEIRIADADPSVEGVGMLGGMVYENGIIRTYIPVTDVNPATIIFRKQEDREPIPPGGTSDYSNENAPKTTESNEIESFYCYISLLSFDMDDASLFERPFCELSAERDGDSVRGRALKGAQDITFSAGAAFLEELQKIVRKYDLAQFNGLDVVTHGLPENFGAELRIEYASGERIAASNNNMMFLPPDAAQELIGLFFDRS